MQKLPATGVKLQVLGEIKELPAQISLAQEKHKLLNTNFSSIRKKQRAPAAKFKMAKKHVLLSHKL